jgi:hypothetical protein
MMLRARLAPSRRSAAQGVDAPLPFVQFVRFVCDVHKNAMQIDDLVCG